MVYIRSRRRLNVIKNRTIKDAYLFNPWCINGYDAVKHPALAYSFI
jgi:hypothetical protein